jgi:hypothetical protein
MPALVAGTHVFATLQHLKTGIARFRLRGK